LYGLFLKDKFYKGGVREKMATKINWTQVVWRLVRGSVATAFAQTLVLQVNWSDPAAAWRTVIASFVAGFLLALSKGIRSSTDNTMVGKLPI